MNEKIKTFFACIGGFFTAAFAVLVGIFIGKNRGRNNAANAGVAELEEQHTELERNQRTERQIYSELERNQRTERQIYSDLGELIAGIEKRNAEKKDRDRSS